MPETAPSHPPYATMQLSGRIQINQPRKKIPSAIPLPFTRCRTPVDRFLRRSKEGGDRSISGVTRGPVDKVRLCPWTVSSWSVGLRGSVGTAGDVTKLILPSAGTPADLIKPLQNALRGGGRPYRGNIGRRQAGSSARRSDDCLCAQGGRTKLDFSVVVPAYNREQLIGATLDAIFGQYFAPAEVIVVDDGSSDRTAAIASDWPGCRVIRLANGGAADARHQGVLASSNDRLAFCDSDDVWRPGHLAALAAAFDLIPGAGFAFTNFAQGDGHAWAARTKFECAPTWFWNRFSQVAPSLAVAESPIFEEILHFQPIFPSCTAMSRQFYDLVGGYDAAFGHLPSEDLEFTLRCVQHAPIAVVQEATVGVRKHAGNHSGDQMKQLCGEVEILVHSRNNHAVSPSWAAALDEQILIRAGQAIDAAFVEGAWDTVGYMARHLPWRRRSVKQAIKIAVATLPASMAGIGLRVSRS